MTIYIDSNGKDATEAVSPSTAVYDHLKRRATQQAAHKIMRYHQYALPVSVMMPDGWTPQSGGASEAAS